LPLPIKVPVHNQDQVGLEQVVVVEAEMQHLVVAQVQVVHHKVPDHQPKQTIREILAEAQPIVRFQKVQVVQMVQLPAAGQALQDLPAGHHPAALQKTGHHQIAKVVQNQVPALVHLPVVLLRVAKQVQVVQVPVAGQLDRVVAAAYRHHQAAR